MKNYLIVYSYEPCGMWMNTPDIRYGNRIVQSENMNSENVNRIIDIINKKVSNKVTIHNIIKLDD